IPMIVDSVLSYTLYYWDMSDATIDAIVAAGVPGAAVTQVGTWLAAGMGLEDVANALLPYILGNVTGLQAQATAAGAPLTYSNGDTVVVNDSGHDLSFDDFDDDAYYYYDMTVNYKGGRIWAQSYATCFPAKWTQRVDSHWSYMGALSTVNDNSITVDRFELKGNYPNPFNPTTQIRFTNDRSSNVKVTVYALNGEKVATIMNRNVNAGAYDVSWNGRNSNGSIVPTGMYLYDIESDGRRLQGKMLFLK
ncbi:MAG: FlgD immunoglobulin-like domain containing protein, partial [bacterium]